VSNERATGETVVLDYKRRKQLKRKTIFIFKILTPRTKVYPPIGGPTGNPGMPSIDVTVWDVRAGAMAVTVSSRARPLVGVVTGTRSTDVNLESG
jgi:hypothetical protein